MSNWGEYYIDIANVIASKSKDPSTKVGAVIVRSDNTIVSTGYNGFPHGMNDDPTLYENREFKLEHTIHAEMNAILFAREPLRGCRMYVTLMPCSSCALHIAQAGIETVIAPRPPAEKLERWGESFERTKKIFQECGVGLVLKDFS